MNPTASPPEPAEALRTSTLLLELVRHGTGDTIALGDIGWLGFGSMMGFLFVLTVGFVYEWRKGALDWE